MSIDLSIRDIYRTADVDRWGIVAVSKRQSVAEHSYLVAMTAMRLNDYMGSPCQEGVVLWYAMTHDVAEVLTGDLASPLKEILGQEARDNLSRFEQSIRVSGRSPAQVPEKVKQIVKSADLIEAIIFLYRFGIGHHAEKVADRLFQRLDEDAVAVLRDIESGSMTTLDDVIEED